MKAQHYVAIVIALVLTGVLFLVGNPTKTTKREEGKSGKAPAAAMAPGANLPEPARFDSLLLAAKKKLSPAAQAEVSQLENSITRGAVKEQQIVAYEQLGKIWQKFANRSIAAYYFGASGKLENSEKKLNFAAHLLTEELHNERNPNVKQWMAEEAISCYQHSLELNPDNDTVRIDLAGVYINGTGETMKGVSELLSIVSRDSTNVPVNIILGRMAVESGQLDKAVQRGLTVLSVDKDNIEARLFLGEAYKRQGEKQKAVDVFNEAKRIMNNPDFSKDLDEYMKTF